MHDINARQRWRDNEGTGGMVGDRLTEDGIAAAKDAFWRGLEPLVDALLIGVDASVPQIREFHDAITGPIKDAIADATGPQLRAIEDGEE